MDSISVRSSIIYTEAILPPAVLPLSARSLDPTFTAEAFEVVVIRAAGASPILAEPWLSRTRCRSRSYAINDLEEGAGDGKLRLPRRTDRPVGLS